jgi:hypothetical protein
MLGNQECLENVKEDIFFFLLDFFFDPSSSSKQTIFSYEMKLKETCV